MVITGISTGTLSVPLKKPFKTALRQVDSIKDTIIKITTDTGCTGYGEAPPTAVITGDTNGSIVCAINDIISKSLIGLDTADMDTLQHKLHSSIEKNTSAKAAVDMALYDLLGKLYCAPLYKLLGGSKKIIETDLTISLNETPEMVQDSIEAVNSGYSCLKIKVGKDGTGDIERVRKIREAVGNKIALRIDANQGWTPKESVKIIRSFEDLGLDIELVEQPVKAHDFYGLKYVTDNVSTPILADEAVFSVTDALNVIQNRAADLINIKLMKTGGIYKALQLCSIAENYDVECMIGCMLETGIAVTAAAHLAGGKRIITRSDLDGPGLCSKNPVIGGTEYNGGTITLSDMPGLGFAEIDESLVEWHI